MVTWKGFQVDFLEMTHLPPYQSGLEVNLPCTICLTQGIQTVLGQSLAVPVLFLDLIAYSFCSISPVSLYGWYAISVSFAEHLHTRKWCMATHSIERQWLNSNREPKTRWEWERYRITVVIAAEMSRWKTFCVGVHFLFIFMAQYMVWDVLCDVQDTQTENREPSWCRALGWITTILIITDVQLKGMNMLNNHFIKKTKKHCTYSCSWAACFY